MKKLRDTFIFILANLNLAGQNINIYLYVRPNQISVFSLLFQTKLSRMCVRIAGLAVFVCSLTDRSVIMTQILKQGTRSSCRAMDVFVLFRDALSYIEVSG